MHQSEFSIIERFFAKQPFSQMLSGNFSGTPLGIGDDAAIISIPHEHDLVITTDTSISGRHFLESTSASHIAYRSIAVSLSDLAAMGAIPYGFLLNITLPKYDEAWLTEFSSGIAEIANSYDLTLIGGDTTRGPLAISVTHLGLVFKGQAIQRSTAKPGDLIVVSGSLGDAAAGLDYLKRNTKAAANNYLASRYLQPEIQLSLGQMLAGLATSAIDISDGLLADLGHILTKSGVGGVINFDAIPLSNTIVDYWGEAKARQFAVCCGDDYELCFTIPADKRDTLNVFANDVGIKLTIIGQINADVGNLQCLDSAGNPMEFLNTGFNHFNDN